jgi:hypothetical protein
MAISKGSLFSIKSQGRIGKNTLLRTVKGQTVAGAFSASHKPPTAAQSAARANYKAGCLLWRSMPALDKAAWAAQRPQLSTNKGFSNFMKSFLEGGEIMNINEVKALNLGANPPTVHSGDWLLWGAPLPFVDLFAGGWSAGIGEWFEVSLFLPAGTFNLITYNIESTEAGIYELLIDGVPQGSFDCYGASGQFYCYEFITGIVLPSAGLHTVRLECIGKHPDAYMYLILIGILGFRKTA